jgi:hypothetical protein
MTHSDNQSLARILIVPGIVALLLTMFAWPQARLEPRGVPVGVAGPAQEAAAIEEQLAHGGDAFDVHRYADEAAAREAISDRDVYGAIVASAEGPTLLTASAGSPAVAQLLEQGVSEAFAAGGQAATPRVVDVVPTDEDDPRGAAFNSSVLPLLIAGIITGFLVSSLTRPGLRQIGTLVGASALAGLASVAIAQGWLEILGGGWLANAGVLSLMVLAISSLVAGLVAVLGHVGIGVAALLLVLVGNPWSGLGAAPELLPTPVGDIGQLFPPAAGGQALRDTAFFDGAALGGHLSVLVAWATLGLGLIGVATLRKPRVEPAAQAARAR